MDILSALFVEQLAFRQAPGPATRIDFTGVMFSLAAPEAPPVTIEPHLVLLLRCRANETGNGRLTVIFKHLDNAEAEPLANVTQDFRVEPGKFGYRLVKAPLTFDELGTIEAHCSIDNGPAHVVPLALLPPASDSA